ncbi:MAG: PHP-associated domain-containing protein [Patescibacteria group bacterium]
MLLKTNLHFHANTDPEHQNIEYDVFEGIEKAADLGFHVLALTCHGKYALNGDHIEYAESKGVLMLSGIEANIGEKENENRHLIILNCDKDAERIRTFKDLEKYKKNNPHIFVLAPHPFFPYFPKQQSLMKYTYKYSHLFDAVEHSWFYSKIINKNLPAQQFAKEKNLPLVATSDTHFFDFLDTDYCLIEAKNKTPEDVFNAIRKRSFKNVTRPKKLLKEMIFTYGSFHFKKGKRSNSYTERVKNN